MISTHDFSMNSAHYARMGKQECKQIHMATLNLLDHKTGLRRDPVLRDVADAARLPVILM